MSKVNHSQRKHALLSASGAHRWMNCPPSARLEEGFPESTSVFAEEGTLAHEFCDINLQFKIGKITKRKLNIELKKLRAHELYTDEMEGHVDVYVDYVWGAFNDALKEYGDAELLIEEKIDLTEIIEEGFGTGDGGVVSDNTLEIIDFKYGKGVEVSAEDNDQLKLYGFGILRKFDMAYDIEEVKLTIIQPRLKNISSWIISAAELSEWGFSKVKPTAEKAFLGEGIQKAGDWCRWCKAKVKCATLASENLKMARHEFKDPHLLTDAQLVDVYNKMDRIVDWVKAAGAYLLKEALGGKKWPGYKLVEGRATRKWKNEQEVKDTLELLGYDEKDFLNSKVKGIGDIEKLVGKAKFPGLLGSVVIKPQGAPTLVPDTDKRPAMGSNGSAKADFSE